MAALVVFARNGRESGVPMPCGDGAKYRDAPIPVRQSMRNSFEHPGAAQVQPVNMSELRVGTVGDHARLQPADTGALRDAGQKRRQPGRECLGVKDPAHEVRLGEAGGEKILPRGLIAQGAVAIFDIKPLRRIVQQRAHLRIAGDARPIPDQAERESRLVVLADADRIMQLRQPALDARRGFGFKGLKRCGPLPCLWVIPLAQFRGQLQQPCKPVGPLERGAPRMF